MTEIVLIPPTQADISQLPFLADIQYLEPISSAALNRKFTGIVPPGIYRGFEYSMPGGMVLAIGANGAPGTAVVERNGYCITVQQVNPASIVVPAGLVGYVVLEAFYGEGVKTRQVSTDSTIDAAALKVIAKADLQPHHIILYSVNTPANAVQLQPDHVTTAQRQDVSMVGSTKVDGGLFTNTPRDCVTIQIRRGPEAERKAYNLLPGELAYGLDSERLAVGSGSRAGGTLQPAAKWLSAAGVTALPQGAYRFGAGGLLLLPSNAANGEHVRVSATPAALLSGAECLVQAEDGTPITTRGGDVYAVAIDVTTELVFIKAASGWRY